MSISSEKEAYIVDQAAISELQKYNQREQTMYETIQKIGKLNLSFVEWQFLYDEASSVLDKQSFRLFKGVALDEMLDLAKGFSECLVVYNMAKKGGKIAASVLEKMKKVTKSEKEKQEMEYLLTKQKY